jgi:hypothetical protein
LLDLEELDDELEDELDDELTEGFRTGIFLFGFSGHGQGKHFY